MVCLGIFLIFGLYLLLYVILCICECFLELELLLVEEKSDVLLDCLCEGKFDVVLLVLLVIDDQLYVEFLFEELFLLVVFGCYLLVCCEYLDVQELVMQKLLLLEDGYCLCDQVLEVCCLFGVNEKFEFCVISLEMLWQMVVVDVGIILLLSLLVQLLVLCLNNICLFDFIGEGCFSCCIVMIWCCSLVMNDFLMDLVDQFKCLLQVLFMLEVFDVGSDVLVLFGFVLNG